MKWVDQNAVGDPQTHLLVVPAYYLHALWLTGNACRSGQVLVMDIAGASEPTAGYAGNALQTLLSAQLLDEPTFLQTLASVPAPMGILLGGSHSPTPAPAGVP